MDMVVPHFEKFGFPLHVNTNIVPQDDPSTLFICSGMQTYKHRFSTPDGSREGSLQSCVRTNDLDLVGDGTHLTYFEMLGNFSFGGQDYEQSIELWHSLICKLQIPVTHITYHPTQKQHQELWLRRGYITVPDDSCVWSDGSIGGYCCEMYVGTLEIGNLVNTLEHSVDVGFGWERLHQVLEGKQQVHETSLFRQDLPPIVADHYRTLSSMRLNDILPGYKGRQSVCRRLLQRVLKYESNFQKMPEIQDWLETEANLQQQRLTTAMRFWKRHHRKTDEWWQKSFGLTLEDLTTLRSKMV